VNLKSWRQYSIIRPPKGKPAMVSLNFKPVGGRG